MYPDFDYFNKEGFNDTDINVIKERIIHLSVSYPGIRFKFNKKLIKTTPKKYFEMFGVKEIVQNDLYTIGVTSSDSDQFEHFSLVNGIVAKGGGRHINIISDDIVNPIREKLVKKFKTIKPADIRNKIRLVVLMNNFMNAKWDSQTKEVLKNSDKEIRDYLSQKDYKTDVDKLVKKIQKNEDIMLPITELFLLKEQAKQNAELKKLTKKKKIKSEKYLPAFGEKKYLFLTEGESASGSLVPTLGREKNGYYMLKGMPLNAYDASPQKFTANKELSELYQIIQNEGYEYIIAATDQDLPGFTIRGILTGFIKKYLPEYKGKYGVLDTPVLLVKKNNKIVRWYYSLQDDTKLKSGEKVKFLKGLGSSNSQELKEIVKQDGLENMIKIFEFDDEKILDDWLNGNKSDKRKEYLLQNEFSIAKA
jgi:DNA gyrase/topoisomerase IV subunit B